MNKRKHSFDKYHAKRVSDREARIREALKILSNGTYKNVTRLARDVSNIVYELEVKSAKDGETPRRMSYTTLVRDRSKYKFILLAHLDPNAAKQEDSTEADLLSMKLHCANIEHENKILRDRLDATGRDGGIEALSGPSPGDKSEDIELLINLVNSIMSAAPDLFYTIGKDQVDEANPIQGLYGPNSLIAEYEILEKFKEICDEHKKRNP